MNYLFIHQNFPGQFRHIAKVLADDLANTVVGLGDARYIKGRHEVHPNIKVLGYEPHGQGHEKTHHYLRDHEGHIRRGQSVVRYLQQFTKKTGFTPDVVICHPGWGEGLFLKDIFPTAKHIQYFEFYYQGRGGDTNFDPEFPASFDDLLRLRIKNNTQLQSLVSCDSAVSPTEWQKSCYPVELQKKITVLHEGIDTNLIQPDSAASIVLNGVLFKAGEKIVTYVARNLEPYRGFHTFIRALPHLQKLSPDARVIIVGGDDVSYGKRPPDGKTYRQLYCNEVIDQVDWDKVFFVGKLPYARYIKVLQVSAAHVYLTYPFVLSWSMLEAMSAGCLVLGSNTPPVKEVIEDSVNGFLVDFGVPNSLAVRIAEVLKEPSNFQNIRSNARHFVINHFDLQRICLPKWLDFIDK